VSAEIGVHLASGITWFPDHSAVFRITAACWIALVWQDQSTSLLADAVRQLVITKMMPQEGLEARLCQVVYGPVPAEPPILLALRGLRPSSRAPRRHHQSGSKT
jgi:hypothetical protein